jgi:GNAT superfamily N-acetyltransferase
VEAVRGARPADRDRLTELVAELAQTVRSQRGGAMLVDGGSATGPLAALVDGARSRVMVGTLDGSVVGIAAAHLDGVEVVTPRAVLDACYVEPAARGLGLGRLLLDAVLAWALEQGCGGVDGAALPGDRLAKNFYEAAGFKARVLTMYRSTG